MNDNAKELVAVLESGEFEQGTNCLSRHDKHCCLGVACLVYQKRVGGLDISLDPSSERVSYDGTRVVMPNVVRNYFGFQTTTGLFHIDSSWNSLAGLNDSGKSFKEIAAVIKSEPQGLFV